jgi:hypothetical protein
MFDIPYHVRINVKIEKWTIHASGFDPKPELAAIKARSELVERIYTSDLANEDTTGLFTYRKPAYWCSTGAAAHPDRDQCLENSLAEIIERDSVSCWFSMSRTYEHLTTIKDIELWKIPCIYKGWNVVVSRKKQGDRTQIQAGASRLLEDAMKKAFWESYLKDEIPPAMTDSRLPNFTPGPVKTGDLNEPYLFLREWKVDDLFVVKQYSYHTGDMRRGVPLTKVDIYKEFLGDNNCQPIPIHFNWCH